MEECQFLRDSWTIIVLDNQLIVTEIINPDNRLFFGESPVASQKFSGNFPADSPKYLQMDRIMDGIGRAMRERRNVYLEYISSDKGSEVAVVMHVEYRPEGTVRLHAMAVNLDDMRRVEKNRAERSDIKTLSRTIYEDLPIGMEIYDGDGNLIDLNLQEIKMMGIQNKDEVMGINLFTSPDVPDGVKSRLRAGKNVHFTTDYDFDRAGRFYTTTRKEKRYFTVAISIVFNEQGSVDRYLLFSQDITGQVLYQQKYEELYYENRMVLNSLPVGVGLYSDDGSLLYCNETINKIFGADAGEYFRSVNFFDNSVIPKEIQDALRSGEPIHMHFPYNVSAAGKEQDNASGLSRTLHIECNGRPLIGDKGHPGNYVFIIEDVTESVDNEEKLRQGKRKNELAMHDADIMIWELDVRSQLFFSENDPINDRNFGRPITVGEYTESIHPEDRAKALDVFGRMLAGEDFTFNFDARILLPGNPEWQYCAINGSPYERDSAGKVSKYVGSRKNNTELQKKKMLQENILNSLPIPIHIKDLENDLRYVFCNDESTRMFGSRTDATIYDVMDEEQVIRIEKTDKEVFSTGKPYLGFEHIVLKDGRSYDTIVRKSIIYDGKKRLLLSVRWDQSMQNDLERRAKLLSLTLEAMNAFTWFYEPDKTLISFGEGFDKIGRKASEVNTLDKFLTYVHPGDRQMFRESLETVAAKDSGVWEVECQLDLDGNGTYSWWQIHGMLETTVLNDAPYKYMFGMTISIEAHKQAELTLLKNKEDLNHLIRQNELVLNNTNSGLAFITPDYIVQWENVSVCSASLSFEAYKKGEPCYKSAHNRTSPCEECIMQRAFRSHQVEQIKFTLSNARTVEVFGTPVLADNGDFEGVVIRIDDITEREQMIEELKQAKILAEQSDKLKSAFLANMSHEIRTPLNAIVGFSELLKTSVEEEEKEEYIHIINTNNELLLKLINDILDLSKIEAGSVELKYEEFDLSEYFDGMAASMKLRVKNPRIQLMAVNPYPVCIVRLDRNRVAQILTNYVTNAIKYTPEGFIEMGYECVDEGIRFYVKDTGIGISDEKKDKVFHRFEKLDEFAQGTGLGLSICKAIAESMGGQVGFESRYGEGSLFWALLPCDPDVRPRDTEDESETENILDSSLAANLFLDTETGTPVRRTILVAEDIASNYLLASALLKKNYNLLHAENGEEAVKMVQRHDVDLLLMDMKMPVMDGLKATVEIRKFNRKLPIVALTAHAFDSDHQAALAAGCNDYLVKPIDKIKLMSILRKYCGIS